MRFSLSRGHNLIAYGFRKGNVDQPVPVHVSEFAPSQAELQAAESVRSGLDPGPPACRLANALLRSSNGHCFLLS